MEVNDLRRLKESIKNLKFSRLIVESGAFKQITIKVVFETPEVPPSFFEEDKTQKRKEFILHAENVVKEILEQKFRKEMDEFLKLYAESFAKKD